ncbi:MAG: C39 family peptidase [Thermoanaerobaculia bacterium]|nr:C39 family peptidase [Thermoanaerobaculia bacterium]
MEALLELPISRQPNDATCGPTCLQALYSYYYDAVSLGQIVAEVEMLKEGGTLGVMLGSHALSRGYQATLFSYNLTVFDPTWSRLSMPSLREKLDAQGALRRDAKRRAAIAAYIRFLDQGGSIAFEELSGRLLRRYLDRRRPILAGLSATYLYRSAREISHSSEQDDLRGEPVGHFVVLCGYDRATRTVLVADPEHPNPLAPEGTYAVGIDRLIASILLGALTYDANLLILEPPEAP